MRRSRLALYGLAHFWVDLSCAALLLGTLSGEGDFQRQLLVYNFCAFALQMPLGVLADWWGRPAALGAAGCVLTAAAYLVPLPLRAVTAGAGNALFHLGGGVEALSSERAGDLGVFVSPGALGIFLGTLWGKGAAPGLRVLPLGLLVLAFALVWRAGDALSAPPEAEEAAPARWGALVPLFLVVVLRSYMGMNQAFPWKADWAPALAAALVLGKAAGGFAMDALGPRKASAASLGLAAALYPASALPLPGVLAVFLFNMTMPVTLWAAAQAMPGAKGFTFGLLTFALFLGFLPSFLGWPSLLAGPWAYAAAALVSLALLWGPLGRRAARC